MTPSEIARVQSYLRQTFGTNRIVLSDRPQRDGSVEVLVNDEFVGVIFRDDEDGEVSYDFHMAILQQDLPAAPGPRGR